MKKHCFVVKCLCILVFIRCIYYRASQSLAMLICSSPRGLHSMRPFPILFNSRTMFTWSISWSWCSTEYMLRNAVLEMHEQIDFKMFSRHSTKSLSSQVPERNFPLLTYFSNHCQIEILKQTLAVYHDRSREVR